MSRVQLYPRAAFEMQDRTHAGELPTVHEVTVAGVPIRLVTGIDLVALGAVPRAAIVNVGPERETVYFVDSVPEPGR